VRPDAIDDDIASAVRAIRELSFGGNRLRLAIARRSPASLPGSATGDWVAESRKISVVRRFLSGRPPA